MHLPWRIPEYGPRISTSLTTAEAQWLRDLATGQHVLEIGAAYGYSTVLMAGAALSVVSIDPHADIEGSHAALLANLKAAGLSADVRIGRSQEVLPTLSGSFGLVFIDGDHNEWAVRADWQEANRLVAKFGAIAVHDWGEDSCPGVRAAIARPPDELVDTLAVFLA